MEGAINKMSYDGGWCKKWLHCVKEKRPGRVSMRERAKGRNESECILDPSHTPTTTSESALSSPSGGMRSPVRLVLCCLLISITYAWNHNTELRHLHGEDFTTS